jgi:hypothetical protein
MAPVCAPEDIALPANVCMHPEIASVTRRLLSFDPKLRPSAEEALNEVLKVAAKEEYKGDGANLGRLGMFL